MITTLEQFLLLPGKACLSIHVIVLATRRAQLSKTSQLQEETQVCWTMEWNHREQSECEGYGWLMMGWLMINESLYDCIVIITVRISLYIYIYASLSKPPPHNPGVCHGGGRQKCMYVCMSAASHVCLCLSLPPCGWGMWQCGGVKSKCMYVCMHACR